MSFKRDGDDLDMLRRLKHHRVCELLANHIPDDEAMLLKNGRLTCMICTHRPIFNTLSMLAVHRKGKKHVSELSKYLVHKRMLEMKKLKCEHRKYSHSGPVVDSLRHGTLPGKDQGNEMLITEVTYTGCGKEKLGLRRKAILDIENLSKGAEISRLVTKTGALPSASAQVRQYLKGLWKKRPLEKTVEKCQENYGEGWQSSTSNVVNVSVPDCPESRLESHESVANPHTEENLTLKKKAEHELKLRMNGWVKNACGTWVQDPDVEFDSGEDEPPIFPD